MASHQQACCSQQHQLESLAETLAESAGDPTLSACCKRDLEEQAAVAQLKAQLTAVDRSNVRKQLVQGVLRAGPTPQEAAAAEEEEDWEGGEDDDETLARLRELRLQELQRQRAHHERLQAAGHGMLTAVPSQRLLEFATSSDGPLVCHLATEGCQACDELDEHLTTLAHEHLGTRFVRSVVPHGSRHMLHTLRLAGPGLACFRDGALLGSADLGMFVEGEDGRGGLVEELVTAWLRRQRTLQRAGAAAPNAGGAAATGEPAGSEEDEDREEESWQPACEVCGRRYPHQHIRSAFVSRGEVDASDEEP